MEVVAIDAYHLHVHLIAALETGEDEEEALTDSTVSSRSRQLQEMEAWGSQTLCQGAVGIEETRTTSLR